MKPKKIGQVESHFAQTLEIPLKNILHQFGYSVSDQDQLQVELHKGDRKTRSDAAANYWSPDAGWMKVYFVPRSAQSASQSTGAVADEPRMTAAPISPPQTDREESALPGTYVHPAEADLLRALDRAESTPGWSFVPLRKFRDEIIPAQNLDSMRTDVEQQHMLRSAIEKRLILVGKVPNPKNPQFPVTTIRLNRLRPEVRQVLGQGKDVDLDFRPVEIRGEPLSTTILRERR